MDALYSPTSQTLTLIPRLSSFSSSSSATSTCLGVSRIGLVRNEFFGCSAKLRLQSRRKCKSLRCYTTSTQSPVALLSSLPVVVVVVMTVSAAVAAAVYSTMYRSKRKEDSIEVSGLSSSESEQVGEDTSDQAFHSPSDAEDVHIGLLKDKNFSSKEVTESTLENENALSFQVTTSTPKDTLKVDKLHVPDSSFPELGTVSSIVPEKSEPIVASLPQLSPESDIKQQVSVFTEKSEALSLFESSVVMSLPQASPELHDLGQRAPFTGEKEVSTLSNRSEVIAVSLPATSPELEDLKPLEPFTEISEVTALPEGSEAIVVSGSQASPELDELESLASSEDNSAAPAFSEGSEVVTVSLPQVSPTLGDLEPNILSKEKSESSLSEKGEGATVFLQQASSDLDALESLAPFKEKRHLINGDTDLNVMSPDHVVEINGAVSELFDFSVTKDSKIEESMHEYDKPEKSVCRSARSGRQELYMLYESTSVPDYPTLMHRASGNQSLEHNTFAVTTRKTSFKVLQRDHSVVAGVGGHGPVASHEDGSLDERKHLSKKRGRPKRDLKDSSFPYGHQKSTDIPNPDMLTMQVNGQHTASRHMNSYNRLLKTGRLNECVNLLEDMNSKDMLDMTKIYHAKFFDICRKQRAVKEAFRFVKLIPNPTLSTFNMLLSVCSAAKDSEGAFEAWQLVHQAGLRPDCKLYTTLISTCAKSGKVDTMFEVFHEMVNRGVEPNVHTYGSLIDGCARAGQVAKAFGAYGILRSKLNVKPDRAVFNALITACGQSGAVERAFDVLAEMGAELHPVDPDHITIGALIRACTRSGQVDRVKGVYALIDQYGIKGSPELYTIAVNSCSETCDWEFACSIYADMRKKGVIPDEMFFSALIDVAGHAVNLDAAFAVLEDARSQGMKPGIMSYSSLMGACSNTRNGKKALELFEQIKAMNLNPTVSTVNALITAFCDCDQMQKALDILSEMRDLDLRPNDVTYSILIAACEKNDDIESGLALFSQAKADAVPFSQIMCKCLIKMCLRRFEKSSTLGEAVVSFKSGRPLIDSKWSTLALMIYREMIGAGLFPSMEMVSQVLGCLQLPKDASVKKRLTETLEISAETSRKANLLPLIDGFSEYDPRAFSLFEEAASLSIVPGVSFKESPISIDVGDLSNHLAEVYILTVLKALKHRLAAGARLPTIAISLPVETTEISVPAGEKSINVSGRVSQAVGALLRRLRLPYQGNESHGKIRITGLAVKRWFQPKLVPSLGGKQSQLGLLQLNLSQGISRQQQNIRTGNLSLY